MMKSKRIRALEAERDEHLNRLRACEQDLIDVIAERQELRERVKRLENMEDYHKIRLRRDKVVAERDALVVERGELEAERDNLRAHLGRAVTSENRRHEALLRMCDERDALREQIRTMQEECDCDTVALIVEERDELRALARRLAICLGKTYHTNMTMDEAVVWRSVRDGLLEEASNI